MSGRQVWVVETRRSAAAPWLPAHTMHLRPAVYLTRAELRCDLYNGLVTDEGGGLRTTRYQPERPPAPAALCDLAHGPWRTVHPASASCVELERERQARIAERGAGR